MHPSGSKRIVCIHPPTWFVLPLLFVEEGNMYIFPIVASRYGFHSLQYRGIQASLFLTSTSPDFQVSKQSKDDPYDGFQYTLVVYPAPQADQSKEGENQTLTLHFFVIVTVRGTVFPLLTLEQTPKSTVLICCVFIFVFVFLLWFENYWKERKKKKTRSHLL
jgi:hypothetical protein